MRTKFNVMRALFYIFYILHTVNCDEPVMMLL